MTSEEEAKAAAAALGPLTDDQVNQVAHLLNTAPRTRRKPAGPPPTPAQVADEMRAAHAALSEQIEAADDQ